MRANGLTTWMAARILAWLSRRIAAVRSPDLVIEEAGRVYLKRWWVVGRNPWLNVYLHEFRASDEARALHDHPWLWNASLLLAGAYHEHTIAAGGIHRVRALAAGGVRLRLGPAPHRIELLTPSCWTLFVTGPVVRKWGFHCPRGFVKHDDWSQSVGCGEGQKS